jgi:hypothetical protein
MLRFQRYNVVKETTPKQLELKTVRNKQGKKFLKIPSKVYIEPTIENLSELRQKGLTPIQVSRFFYNTLNFEHVYNHPKLKSVPKLQKYELVTKILNQRAPAEIMLRSGFSVKELKDAGYTAKEILYGSSFEEIIKNNKIKTDFLVSPRKLRENGYTARDLVLADLTAKQILDAGYGLPDLIDGGFGRKTLHDLGFSEKLVEKLLEKKHPKRYKK